MAVSTITPPGKSIQVKQMTVARTDTAYKSEFMIPKGAIPLFITIQGTVASDAGTSATVKVSNTTSGNVFGSGNVKGSGASITLQSSDLTNTVMTSDTVVYGQYSESGTASTVGGPWTVSFFYTI